MATAGSSYLRVSGLFIYFFFKELSDMSPNILETFEHDMSHMTPLNSVEALLC